MEKFRLVQVSDEKDVNIRLQKHHWYGWCTVKLVVCDIQDYDKVIVELHRTINLLNKI